jgi:hypothetical protein
MCAMAQNTSECQEYAELRRIPIPRTSVNKEKEEGRGSPLCTPALLFWLTTTPTLVDEAQGVDDLISTHFVALFAPHTRILARPAGYGVHPSR